MARVEETPPTLDYAGPRTDTLRPRAWLWVAAALVWTASAAAIWSLAKSRARIADEMPGVLWLLFWASIAIAEASAVFGRSIAAAWLVSVPAWMLTAVLCLPCLGLALVNLASLEPVGLLLLLVPVATGFVAIENARWANALLDQRRMGEPPTDFRGTI